MSSSDLYKKAHINIIISNIWRSLQRSCVFSVWRSTQYFSQNCGCVNICIFFKIQIRKQIVCMYFQIMSFFLQIYYLKIDLFASPGDQLNGNKFFNISMKKQRSFWSARTKMMKQFYILHFFFVHKIQDKEV